MKSVVAAMAAAMLLSLPVVAMGQVGPYPAEIAAWTEVDKAAQREAGAALVAKLQKAVTKGEKRFVVPKGDYRFSKVVNAEATRWYQCHVLIKGATGLEIDGSGSTFWFETGGIGIQLEKCKDVVLRNLTLDWNPLPYAQGKVLAVSGQEVELKFSPGYETVTPEFARLGPSNDVSRGSRIRFQVMDEKGRFKQGTVGMRLDPFWSGKTEGGTYKTKVFPFVNRPLAELGVAVGDSFVALYRDTHGMQVAHCDNVTLEDVTLHAAPFVAIMESATDRRTTYRRVKVIKRPGTDRLLGGNADGIQITNARQGPLIEDCEIDSIGDDFVNAHGYYYRVLAHESPTTVICDAMGYRTEVKGEVPVSFMGRGTWSDLGQRTAKVEPVQYAFGSSSNELLKTPTGWMAGGLSSGPTPGRSIAAHRLTLDKAIELPADSVLACEDFVSAGTVIRNNRFHNSLAIGIRLQAPNTVIEGNRLSWSMNAMIQLLTQPERWGESSHPDGAIVRNNVIENPVVGGGRNTAAIAIQSPGDLNTSRWIRDVRVEGNVIKNASSHGVRTWGIRGLTLRDNRVEGFGMASGGDGGWGGSSYGYLIERSEGVVSEGNTATGGGPRAAEGEAVKTR